MPGYHPSVRNRHLAGYFTPELVIKNAEDGDAWMELQSMFPDMASAFAEVAGGGSEAVAPAASAAGSQEAAAPAAQTAGTALESRFSFSGALPKPPPYQRLPKVYPSERNGGKKRANRVAIKDLDGKEVSAWDTPGKPAARKTAAPDTPKASGKNAVEVSLKTMDGLMQLLECEINACVPEDKRQRVVQIVEKLRRERDALSKAINR